MELCKLDMYVLDGWRVVSSKGDIVEERWSE